MMTHDLYKVFTKDYKGVVTQVAASGEIREALWYAPLYQAEGEVTVKLKNKIVARFISLEETYG